MVDFLKQTETTLSKKSFSNLAKEINHFNLELVSIYGTQKSYRSIVLVLSNGVRVHLKEVESINQYNSVI